MYIIINTRTPHRQNAYFNKNNHRFVNIPTTLLAMVDASVGGKTGVNTSHGKNLLGNLFVCLYSYINNAKYDVTGTFWQPSLVIAPIGALKTLSDFEYSCGLGEVVSAR